MYVKSSCDQCNVSSVDWFRCSHMTFAIGQMIDVRLSISILSECVDLYSA